MCNFIWNIAWCHTPSVCVDLQLFVYQPLQPRVHVCSSKWPSPPSSRSPWPSLPKKGYSQWAYFWTKDTSQEMTVIVWWWRSCWILTELFHVTYWVFDMFYKLVMLCWHHADLCSQTRWGDGRGQGAEVEGGVALFGLHCPHWLACIP